MIRKLQTLAAACALALLSMGQAFAADKPTIVLVHGAFADSSSWDGVTKILVKDGYKVIGAANPLRSIKGDAAYVASLVASVSGPVVLVGHSYGGVVISNAANGHANVKSLVFVSAFAPDEGEKPVDLVGKFPGSTLPKALAPAVSLADGVKDIYIDQTKFRAQFAADVPEAQAALMAANQRPVAEAIFGETSGKPAWKQIPSWFIYGAEDYNIPPAAISWMAKRAGAKESIEVKGASHVVMISHPEEVAKIIEEAAK